MAQSSDLLTGASLILAGLAIFYDRWYEELINAANVGNPPRYDENAHKLVVQALKRRSTPLIVAAALSFIVFLPDTLGIAAQAFSLALREGLSALPKYDAIRASLVLVELLFLGLVGVSWSTFSKLKDADRTWKRLKPK